MTSLYQIQRAMREKRQTALQRGVVALLDIGTSKIGCLILRFNPEVQKRAGDGIGAVASHGSFRIIGAAKTRSRGVERGDIIHLNEATSAIRTAVQKAQKMAQTRVDHVLVCTSGGRIQSGGLSGQAEVSDDRVTQSDIGAALANCAMPDLGPDRQVLHALPVNFALDHNPSLINPLGQIGHLLGVDMNLVTIDAHQFAHLQRAVQQCDLELAGVVSSAYCTAISALVEDEQEIGAACIDIGRTDSIRIGGDHITKDLSLGLQIPKSTAERIKTLHGGLVATAMDDRDLIDVESETGDWNYDRRQFTRSEIIGIIRPRVEEIFEYVHAKLLQQRFDTLPSQRIVLTGGSSQIPSLEGIASRILGQQVRMGRPLRIQGLPQATTGPDFSALVGLSLYAAHPQDECWDFDVEAPAALTDPAKKVMNWFKEHW